MRAMRRELYRTQNSARPWALDLGLRPSPWVFRILPSSLDAHLFQPIRGGCIPFRVPRSAFRKITKRTHFVILNYPITTTLYPDRVQNRHEKRTHFMVHQFDHDVQNEETFNIPARYVSNRRPSHHEILHPEFIAPDRILPRAIYLLRSEHRGQPDLDGKPPQPRAADARPRHCAS